MEKENKEKRSWPVYTFLLILLVLVVLLAGIIIWQFTRINTLYNQSQAQIESVVSSLQELEDFSKQTIPANNETQPKISVSITYPPTLETQSTFESLLNTIQTENSRSLSSINNLLMIFSILITVVVIVVPIFNYAFIQKDQIRKLEKQFFEFGKKFSAIEKQASAFEGQFSRYETRFSEFEGKFNETNERISKETIRLDGSIKQAIDVANSLVPSRPEKASEDITPISDSPIDRAFALSLDARLLFSKGEIDDAVLKISEAICLNEGNASFYNFRFFLYQQKSLFEEALSDASEAIRLDPANAEYYYVRGFMLHELERYSEALLDESKAIELNSQNARYYVARGITYSLLKRYDEALADDNKAVELSPKNTSLLNERSRTLVKYKKYYEALLDAQRAYRFDVGSKYNLAWVLYLNGHYSEALRFVEHLAEDCDSYLAFRTRALTRTRLELLKKKKISSKFIDEVKADLEHAIVLNSKYPFGFIRYAEAMILLKQLPEAYEKLEKAIEMDPEEPEAYHWLAEYYRAMGDAKKAKMNDKLADKKGYIPEP